MGRGRAKAKQTKVARELKYREFDTDFTELQRELHGEPPVPVAKEPDPAAAAGDVDPYADTYDGDAQSASRH
jgi:hypothetical protein